MQKKSKRIMAVIFLIGISLFWATAFADIRAESGYNIYKNAIKNTAAALTKQFDSFTLETMVCIKVDDRPVATYKLLAKEDVKKNVQEHTEVFESDDGEEIEYSYSDNSLSIRNTDYGTFYVTEHKNKDKESYAKEYYVNPFEKERAKDIEIIFDALIGDIRNYATLEKKEDGYKEISGSINESQIPPLMNALASFGVKHILDEYCDSIPVPKLVNEIYIKQVNGTATITKDNIVENNHATFIVSGMDKKGGVYEIELDIVFKIYDINSTNVTKPELTGKDIEVREEAVTSSKCLIDDRYLGKWKNEVVDVQDKRIIRKATRLLTIISIDNEYIRGSYVEQRHDQENKTISIDFTAEIQEDYTSRNVAMFEFTDIDGKEGCVTLRFNTTDIHFWDEETFECGSFNKVFEESN